MLNADQESNWKNASALQRRIIEARLRCPKCTAWNRPGVSYIKVEDDGRATCSGCALNAELFVFDQRE